MRFYSHEKGLARSKSFFNGREPSISFNKFSHHLLTCLVGFGLFGCGTEFSSKKLNNGDKNKTTQPQGSIKETAQSSASIVVTGLAPHHYQAAINWPEGVSGASVVVNKKSVFKAESPLIHSFKLDLEDNQSFIVQIISVPLDSKEPKIISEWNIKTPTDLVLSDIEVDPSLENQNKISLTVNRLFIPKADRNNFSLLTEGKDFIINTGELIADDSVISTFKKDQKASINKNGLNGGLIIIKAARATGNLSFELRGEHGGDGVNGEPYTSRAPNGANGTSADYNMFACNGEFNQQICYCGRDTAHREAGKDGFPGGPGRDGSNGGRGGNSGAIKIEIAEKSPYFHVDILSQYGGYSGVPGRAGSPQQGGIGGKAWQPSINPRLTLVCNTRTDGNTGPTGSPGKDGIKQPEGNLESNCISIGEGFGRCS